MRGSLIVFVGGGIGSCLRAALLEWLAGWGGALPAPVLLANLLGSFVLGVVFVLVDEAELLGIEARLFLVVGVLGGFTTFSTFAWGADVLLADSGGRLVAVAYLLASVAGGVLSVWLGLGAGRLVGRGSGQHEATSDNRLGAPEERRPGDSARGMGAVEAEER